MSEREKRSVGNYYKYLSKLEEGEPELEEHKNTCKSIVREKRLVNDFNDLPEDTINLILAF